MRNALLVTLLASVVLLAGCPKRDAVKEGAAGTGQDSASSSSSGDTGVGEGQSVGGTDAQQMQGALAERIVYFDYDSSEIRPEFNALISAHAKNLASNPRLRLRLEGHSDERGSREYNIGLGERRAQTVRRALMLQGAGDAQIATISYGEERPAVQGSDEAAWSKNRRVEIVYAN